MTARGNLKQPTRQNAIDWISAAWDDIPVDIIKNSFVLCGITADIAGADDDKLFSHVPKVVASELDDSDDDDESDIDDDQQADFDSFDSF